MLINEEDNVNENMKNIKTYKIKRVGFNWDKNSDHFV